VQFRSAESVQYWLFWNSRDVTDITPTSFNFQLSSQNNDAVIVYAADSSFCQASFMDAAQFPGNVLNLGAIDSLTTKQFFAASGPARKGMCIGVKCNNSIENCNLKGKAEWFISTNNTQSCKYGVIPANPNNVVYEPAFGSCASPNDNNSGQVKNPVYLQYADLPGAQPYNAVYCEGTTACLDRAFVNEMGELNVPKAVAASVTTKGTRPDAEEQVHIQNKQDALQAVGDTEAMLRG
jgi:hypothetical protein